MYVYYETSQIEKLCRDQKAAQRTLGTMSAKKLQMRLLELEAAKSLADISHKPPQRLHQLAGEGRRFAVSLHGGHRLVFRAEGGGERGAVHSIVITYIGDYHD